MGTVLPTIFLELDRKVFTFLFVSLDSGVYKLGDQGANFSFGVR